jgi:RND family efflux transporter MFP subunit
LSEKIASNAFLTGATDMKAPRLLLISIACIAFAIAIANILDTDPVKRKKRPEAPTPELTVMPAIGQDHAIKVTVHGTVQAADTLTIRPQVGGQLTQLHPDFEPGGIIPAGETLFVIDDHDYQLKVKAAQAAVRKANADIKLELGKRKVADEELKLLRDSTRLDANSRALARRNPQLQQVQAELQAAQVRLEQAETELERTQSQLPYAVIVLQRERSGDEILAARDSIGQVARADRFWLALQVPENILPRLRARSSQQAGSKVTLNWHGAEYQAEVTRIEARLNGDNRMASILAEIADPLALKEPSKPKLLINSYITAQIDAGVLRQSVAVPRSAMYNNQRIWYVDKNSQLQAREVKPLYRSDTHIYIAPLAQDEFIVLDKVNGLLPGSPVLSKKTETFH